MAERDLKQRMGTKLHEMVDAYFPDAEGFTYKRVTIGRQTIGSHAGDRFKFDDVAFAQALHIKGLGYAVIQGSYGNGALDFGTAKLGDVGITGSIGCNHQSQLRQVGRWT